MADQDPGIKRAAAKVTRKFDSIAERLKAGADYREMDAEVDKLLGTEMEPRDRVVEAAFQRLVDGEDAE